MKPYSRGMKRQKPLGGGIRRRSVSSCVAPQVRKRVEQEAVRFGCSKSLVIVTALAEFFGIKGAV